MAIFSAADLAAMNKQSQTDTNPAVRAMFFRASSIPGDLAAAVNAARNDPDPESRRVAALVVAAAQVTLGNPPAHGAALGWW